VAMVTEGGVNARARRSLARLDCYNGTWAAYWCMLRVRRGEVTAALRLHGILARPAQ
jgi:hypothetical protein